MKAVQKRIWSAYLACEKLCESSRDADSWLRRSFEAALAGEKRHRRASPDPTRYKMPVADTARLFSVRWFLSTTAEDRPLMSYADACSLREDCLFAYGARDTLTGEKLRRWAEVREQFSDVLALDYVKDVVRS